MKKLLILALILFSCISCTSQTQYGKCVGIADDKDPKLIYKLDTTNMVLGIIFIETIIVPIVVVNDQLFCPVGIKP